MFNRWSRKFLHKQSDHWSERCMNININRQVRNKITLFSMKNKICSICFPPLFWHPSNFTDFFVSPLDSSFCGSPIPLLKKRSGRRWGVRKLQVYTHLIAFYLRGVVTSSSVDLQSILLQRNMFMCLTPCCKKWWTYWYSTFKQ